MTILRHSEQISLFSSFIRNKGIPVKEQPLDPPNFLPGLRISVGELLYDSEKLLYPGDMLHEAGHIAVTKTIDRPFLNDNVTAADAAKEGEEMAVLLWTYAACVELNIAPDYVFHPNGYKNQSDWLIENFQAGIYPGLPLLVWMEMTDTRTFPKMKKWLRD